MFTLMRESQRKSLSFRICSCFLSGFLMVSLIVPPNSVYAQALPGALNLPMPGAMINFSEGFAPPIIRGLTLDPQNPLKFDFIIDTGDENLQGEAFKDEAQKLIKYFLASLTVPDEEFWVNLSPYEEGRIIADGLGVTEMGRDLLAQDYILKQLASSLMFPEKELGKEFWQRVFKKAQERFGTTDIPVQTFNKIWIVPDKAVVYEHSGYAFVGERHLKVMVEEDYFALTSNQQAQTVSAEAVGEEGKDVNSLSSEIVREILIPEIEKEVNEGKQFANLRQIYNSVILAAWYKRNLKDSLLGQVYVNKNKIRGIDLDDKAAKEKIYEQYMAAIKKGVFNFIKEDVDPVSQQVIPRKYFSGGLGSGVATPQRISVRPLVDQAGRVNSAVLSTESRNPQARLQRTAVALVENAGASQIEVVQPAVNAAVLGPQDQETVKMAVAQSTPKVYGFIKDAPILGYRITSSKFEDLPAAIRDRIGEVDQTKYTEEYLAANIGSIIALQMNGDQADFYVVGKDTFDKKYRTVGAAEVGTKNAKLMGRLQTVAGIQGLVETDPNVVGALKTVPVQMVRMSEVGYKVEDQVTIQSPWGEQTKPAGQDGFLVFDESKDQYYMVNQGQDGNPISYVPSTPTPATNAAVVSLQSQDDIRSAIGKVSPTLHGFIKDAPILGYRITSSKFEDLPAAIRDRIGEVDQTKYTEEYLAANIGSIIALQMNGNQADFYVVGKDTFDKKYRTVGAAEVGTKNAKLMGRLQTVPGIQGLLETDPNVVGALKTVPVQMVRMSEVGYKVEDQVPIQSPWGEQTKPAGQDGFLVLDESNGQYYMVNQGQDGNPISYVATTPSATNAAVLSGPAVPMPVAAEGVEIAEYANQMRELGQRNQGASVLGNYRGVPIIMNPGDNVTSAVNQYLSWQRNQSTSLPFTATQEPSQNVGGIDLNPSLLDLQIKRDGSGVPLPLPQQPIENMNIEGFYPVIINVAPVTPSMILGEMDAGQEGILKLSALK